MDIKEVIGIDVGKLTNEAVFIPTKRHLNLTIQKKDLENWKPGYQRILSVKKIS